MNNGSEWQKGRKMTPVQLKKICAKWGMSRAKVRRFLGISPRRWSRLMDGEYQVRPPEAMLLNSMLEHGERPL